MCAYGGQKITCRSWVSLSSVDGGVRLGLSGLAMNTLTHWTISLAPHTSRTKRCLCATQLPWVGFKEYIVHTGQRRPLPERQAQPQCNVPPQGWSALNSRIFINHMSKDSLRGVGLGKIQPSVSMGVKGWISSMLKGFFIVIDFFFETEFQVFQAGLKLTLQPRMTLLSRPL